MKLEITNLNVELQKEKILKNLSLTVEKGEFLSLLGPSGCGKSTLLKSIAGILPLSDGTITIDGQDVTNLPMHKRGTVIVFQDIRLFPNMNVRDNVAFPLKMQGVSKTERSQIAEDLLEKVQMKGLGNRKISEISGGQQQRVALARALAAKPKLLLLDEPFSALDENLREEIRALVLQLHREFGMTTILVTHDREEALSMSDRIAVIFDGEMVQCDTAQKVYWQPANQKVASYFGDCVFFDGKVQQGEFVSQEIHMETEYPDGNYKLLLRYHALQPQQPGDYQVTVENLQFHGYDTQITFRGEDGSVWKKSVAGSSSWKVGEKLSCALDLSKAILLP